MKTKTLLLTLGFICAAGVAYAADDPMMGTWKLNEGKSKLAAGTGKNDTVVYSSSEGKVKVSVDGTDADGKASHNEWTGKFDGKDYAVSGDTAQGDMRAYTKV